MNQIPSKSEVDAALRSLEPVSPRTHARQAVRKHRGWRSDAEKKKLPVSNALEPHAAPMLDTEAVLARADVGNLIGRK